MIYTSIENEKIKNLKKLNKKKYRDQENLFLIEGDHLVEEAIKTDSLELLIVKENYDFMDYKNKIVVSEKVMKYLSDLDTPKPVMGVCRKNNSKLIGNRIIALDGVQDPGNLGTIIRCCKAFNIDTILISNDTVDPYNSKVIRATQGMIFKTNIIECNLVDTIKELKNYKIFGTDVNNGKDLSTIEIPNKFVVIMGNEGTGVKEDTKKMCNEFIYIKMNEECESLNVAVAAAIIMHSLNK